MTNIDIVKEKLYDSNASLVVLYQNGTCKEYYNRRIEDIVAILLENKDALKGAIIADKVIGKVAGSVLAVAGIKELYADIISEFAIPVLDKNGTVTFKIDALMLLPGRYYLDLGINGPQGELYDNVRQIFQITVRDYVTDEFGPCVFAHEWSLD